MKEESSENEMNANVRRTSTVLGTVVVIVVTCVLLLSRTGRGDNSPGEGLAAVLEAKNKGGYPILRDRGKKIEVERVRKDGEESQSVPPDATFPAKVMGLKLNVPRTITGFNVLDASASGRASWKVCVATPRHSLVLELYSRPAEVFRSVIAEHDLDQLADAIARRMSVSRKNAVEKLARARERILAGSDEALLCNVLLADKEALRESKNWNEAAELFVSLMARDWVWELGAPCYAMKCANDRIYVVYSRQSHRTASLFWVAAFNEDRNMRWEGSVSSRPPSKGPEVVGFIRGLFEPTGPTTAPKPRAKMRKVSDAPAAEKTGTVRNRMKTGK